MRKRGNSWALEWHSGCSEGWWLNSCIYLAVIPFAFVSWSLLVGRSLAKEKREGQERKIVNPDYFLLAYKLIDMVDFFTVETQVLFLVLFQKNLLVVSVDPEPVNSFKILFSDWNE